MKTILSLIIFTFLVISSTFATTTTNNININGSVDERAYNFSLTYNGATLTDGSTIDGNHDLSSFSQTSNFIVKRSSGNLKQNLSVTLTVIPGAFVGVINGVANSSTGLYPDLKFITDYTYSSIYYGENTSSGFVTINIPAGSNTSEANIAGFYFDINGNSAIPAGNYVSTIQVKYETL